MGRSRTLNYSWDPTLKHAPLRASGPGARGGGVGEGSPQRLTWELGNSPFLGFPHLEGGSSYIYFLGGVSSWPSPCPTIHRLCSAGTIA